MTVITVIVVAIGLFMWLFLIGCSRLEQKTQLNDLKRQQEKNR